MSRLAILHARSLDRDRSISGEKGGSGGVAGRVGRTEIRTRCIIHREGMKDRREGVSGEEGWRRGQAVRTREKRQWARGGWLAEQRERGGGGEGREKERERRKGREPAIHQRDTRVWGDVSEDRLTSAPNTIKSLLNIPSQKAIATGLLTKRLLTFALDSPKFRAPSFGSRSSIARTQIETREGSL